MADALYPYLVQNQPPQFYLEAGLAVGMIIGMLLTVAVNTAIKTFDKYFFIGN